MRVEEYINIFSSWVPFTLTFIPLSFLSHFSVDVTNGDWEAGIYKEQLTPLPDVPIIAAPSNSDEEEHDDDDDYFCPECGETSPFVMYCNQVSTFL